MPTFSLLVQVKNPIPSLLQRMVSSIERQSTNDWELVLLVSGSSPMDEYAARFIAAVTPNVRVELRPDGELLAWSCNALLPTLGQWVAFVGQHDVLLPTTLAAMQATITLNAQAQVVYCDEESLGGWGQLSLGYDKPEPDAIRMLSEECFRDLALIRNSGLAAAGGFDRQASDHPRHDLYLRLLESQGVTAFAHTTGRLYRRHRNRLAPKTDDPRDKPYLAQYDLEGVRRHFSRMGIPAKIKQLNGTLDIDFQFARRPSVTVLLVLGDDAAKGIAAVMSLGILPIYQTRKVQVLFTGTDPAVYTQLSERCSGLRYPIKQVAGSLPAALNQEAAAADTDLILFLQGIPLNPRWLNRMVDYSQLSKVKAVGARLMTPIDLANPGCPGAVNAGMPWDARGQLNVLAVPHSVSTLSPACLLVDSRSFNSMAGFDHTYPTLYAMDFTLRLSEAGHTCVYLPASQVLVEQTSTPAPELALFRQAWAGWEDPYRLHQLS